MPLLRDCFLVVLLLVLGVVRAGADEPMRWQRAGRAMQLADDLVVRAQNDGYRIEWRERSRQLPIATVRRYRTASNGSVIFESRGSDLNQVERVEFTLDKLRSLAALGAAEQARQRSDFAAADVHLAAIPLADWGPAISERLALDVARGDEAHALATAQAMLSGQRLDSATAVFKHPALTRLRAQLYPAPSGRESIPLSWDANQNVSLDRPLLCERLGVLVIYGSTDSHESLADGAEAAGDLLFFSLRDGTLVDSLPLGPLAGEARAAVRWAQIGRWLKSAGFHPAELVHAVRSEDERGEQLLFAEQRWRIGSDGSTLWSIRHHKPTRVASHQPYVSASGGCTHLGEAKYFPQPKLIVVTEYGGGHYGCNVLRVLRVDETQ